MTDDKEIWVLGIKNTNADKSFLWDEHIPSISDADVVIVGDYTLPSDPNYPADKIDEIKKELYDKISADGIVIIICTHNILNITKNASANSMSNNKTKQVRSALPCTIKTVYTSKGTKLIYDNDYMFTDYLKHVKYFDYYITGIDDYELLDDSMCDNSYRTVGGNYVQGGFSDGELIVLPPVTDIPIDEGIDKIIAVYKKGHNEARPSWAESLELPGLDGITLALKELENQRVEIAKKIEEKTSQRDEISKFTALLFANGAQLEKIVMESFVLLGFSEIKQERERNKEDWTIEMKFIQSVERGVIEVKGRDKKTSLSDIVQCNKWADDYLGMNNGKTKGIFVSNQFRHDKYPDSAANRKKYEPNELEYSESREICIVPSYVLFEAIRKVLDGQKPSREEIERRLFNTNGVLEGIL